MDELKFVLILSFWFSLGVGKSSLIKRYICDMNPTEIAPTIGASFSTFKIKLEEGKVKMQVILRKTMRPHCVYYLYNLILFRFISLFDRRFGILVGILWLVLNLDFYIILCFKYSANINVWCHILTQLFDYLFMSF